MNQIKNKIEQILKEDTRLWVNQELNQTLLLDLVDKIDEKVIGLLLSDDETRSRFFIKILDSYVFKTNEFKFFMEENKVNNSFTAYKSRIGLTDGKRFLKDTNDVVLDFPYKDCILEGGQSNEDGMDSYYEWQETTYKDKLYENGNKIKDGKTNAKEIDVAGHYNLQKSKRNEVFFNQVLAKDEIDRLRDDKVLVNWKRFSANGECGVETIKRDSDATIKENLIIKGNNLLALHILKKQFAGKVKLIYIDPPYYFNAKKKEDTFIYNSNFKLSTWLTFMKNRLEVARDLLSSDGAIYVQISDDGVGMLQELLKNVFNTVNENNFINKITVKTKSPSGFASVNAGVFESAEYILSFAKNKKNWTYKPQFVKSEYDDNYKWYIKNKDDNCESWRIIDLFEYIAHINNFKNKQDAIKNLKENVFLTMVADFALEHAGCVCRYTEIGDDAAKEIVDARELSKCDLKIYQVKRSDHYNVYIYKGREIAFYLKKIRQIDGEMTPSIQLSNIWIDTPYEGIAREGGVKLKGGKKPEKLIRRIIEMSTNHGDIVLDYHLGSGTTAAVAHKMGRQYIGIEQMDYIEDLAVTRLKNVIGKVDEIKDLIESETKYKDFDNSGISKAVNWQGGGEFVYCELAKWNEQAKDQIQACTNLAQLIGLFDELYNRYFLNYNFKLKEFQDKVIHEDNFKNLALEQQKEMFLSMLDLNQMYVNKTEMSDSKYGLSASDISLTEQFYIKG